MKRISQPARRIVLQDSDGNIYKVSLETADFGGIVNISDSTTVITLNREDVKTFVEALLEVAA